MSELTSRKAREERLIKEGKNFEHAYMFSCACVLAEEVNKQKEKLSYKIGYLQALADLFECEIEDLL